MNEGEKKREEYTYIHTQYIIRTRKRNKTTYTKGTKRERGIGNLCSHKHTYIHTYIYTYICIYT